MVDPQQLREKIKAVLPETVLATVSPGVTAVSPMYNADKDAIADALLPLVLGELAEVWAEGFEASQGWESGLLGFPVNPYLPQTNEGEKP